MDRLETPVMERTNWCDTNRRFFISRSSAEKSIKNLEAKHVDLKNNYPDEIPAEISKTLIGIEVDIMWFQGKIFEMDAKGIDYTTYS